MGKLAVVQSCGVAITKFHVMRCLRPFTAFVSAPPMFLCHFSFKQPMSMIYASTSATYRLV